MRSKLIYIAGAYSAPTPNGVRANVRQAIGVYMRFCDAGLTPILPHFSHFAHAISPRDYEFWMDLDFRLIEGCGALYRMPNRSSGGDREVVKADELGIPVFRDEAEAIRWGRGEPDIDLDALVSSQQPYGCPTCGGAPFLSLEDAEAHVCEPRAA